MKRKQTDDAEDSDEWTLASATAMCIQNISRVVADAVPLVLLFVRVNIRSPDWRKRETAIMASGQILGGTDEGVVAPLATEAMEVLVGGLVDPHALVRYTTAWTLGRVAEFVPSAITEQAVMPLLSNVMTALGDSPSIAARACFVVQNMAENHKNIAGGSAWLGPAIFGPLIQTLVATTKRKDWEEDDLRASAFEAINRIVQVHTPDCRGIVVELSNWVFTKLHQTFNMTALTEEDRDKNNMLQSSLMAVLHYIIRTCDVAEVTGSMADSTMHFLSRVTQAKNALGTEEAIMCAGQLMKKV
jgi:importin subunit beta-1